MNWKEKLEKEKRAIFKIWEKEFGRPLQGEVQIKLWEDALQIEGVAEADLDGFPHLQTQVLNKLEDLLRAAMPFLKNRDLFLRQPAIYGKKSAQKPKKKYLKPFYRRLHLVDFIIQRRARSKHKRINWAEVTTEWNNNHPYDRFSKPDSLKSLYNQAIRENGLLVYLGFSKVTKFLKELKARGVAKGVDPKKPLEEFMKEVLKMEVKNDR